MQIELYKSIPFKLGDGINWSTGDLKQTALTDFSESPSDGAEAKRNSLSATILESFSDVTRTVSSEARASLGMGVFGGSGGVASFLASKRSASSVQIAVIIQISLSIIQLSKPTSDKQATDIAAFVATHGTHFISARQRGASLIALFSIATQNEEDRLELQGQIKGQGLIGTFDTSASASYAERLSTVTGSRSIALDVEMEGGSFEINTQDWKLFLQQVESFERSVTEANAYNRRIWIEGYDYASGIDGVTALEVQKQVLEQQFALDELARLIQKRLLIQQTIQAVLDHPARYSIEDQTRCSSLKDQVDDSLLKLYQEVQRLRIDPFYKFTADPFPAFAQPKEIHAPPDQAMPPTPSAARLICYTGPSRTGRRFEFNLPGGNFPAELNDQMKSFEIIGNFSANKYWITFFEKANADWAIQTFASPLVANVLGKTIQEFNIDSGRVEDRKTTDMLMLSSSVSISKNLDDSKKPPMALNLGELHDNPPSPFPGRLI